MDEIGIWLDRQITKEVHYKTLKVVENYYQKRIDTIKTIDSKLMLLYFMLGVWMFCFITIVLMVY